QRVVYVTEVAQNSSLNLRARPDYLADIITRLYYGQRLLVIQATEDGWLEVRTDAVQGFVRHEYISDNAPVSP
ncbi:MAG TPA: SH3 domain-containing protein, partial [Clostridia bacterium]|nr:SH3 domain-containing protein [Clostridia bacterium]